MRPGIGLVLGVVDSGDRKADWEVHVNWIDGNGVRKGAGVWRPEDLVVVDDPASLAEAENYGFMSGKWSEQ
jgi:hypothetical protein